MLAIDDGQLTASPLPFDSDRLDRLMDEAGIDVLLEGVADDGNIAEDRDFVVGLGDHILEKAAV